MKEGHLSATGKIGAWWNIIFAGIFSIFIITLLGTIPTIIFNIKYLDGKISNKTAAGVLGLFFGGLIGGLLVLISDDEKNPQYEVAQQMEQQIAMQMAQNLNNQQQGQYPQSNPQSKPTNQQTQPLQKKGSNTDTTTNTDNKSSQQNNKTTKK